MLNDSTEVEGAVELRTVDENKLVRCVYETASVEIPASNMKKAICQILVDEGYIKGMQVKNDTVQGTIVVTLKMCIRDTVSRGVMLAVTCAANE